MREHSEHADPVADLARRIAAIEEGYEFMLAYAAQGRDTDQGAQSSPSIRDFLNNMVVALDGLGSISQAALAQRNADLAATCVAFSNAVDDDARTAQAALRLVLGQPAIGSQLIDNLNASIHLRALLTDLFVIDEVLKR